MGDKYMRGNKFQKKKKGNNTTYCAVIGMIPFEPTPTGMWSKRHCANCSLTGWTSFSWRFVRISLTPQLMSKPTPPGDTTDFGLLMSKAAKLPRVKNINNNGECYISSQCLISTY